MRLIMFESVSFGAQQQRIPEPLESLGADHAGIAITDERHAKIGLHGRQDSVAVLLKSALACSSAQD
jgi:hypothetical protein